MINKHLNQIFSVEVQLELIYWSPCSLFDAKVPSSQRSGFHISDILNLEGSELKNAAAAAAAAAHHGSDLSHHSASESTSGHRGQGSHTSPSALSPTPAGVSADEHHNGSGTGGGAGEADHHSTTEHHAPPSHPQQQHPHHQQHHHPHLLLPQQHHQQAVAPLPLAHHQSGEAQSHAHANAAAAHLLASHNAAAAAAVAAGQYLPNLPKNFPGSFGDEMSSYHHMAQTMLQHSGRSAWIKENELYGERMFQLINGYACIHFHLLHFQEIAPGHINNQVRVGFLKKQHLNGRL